MVGRLAALLCGAVLVLGVGAPAYAAAVRVTVNDTPISDVQIAQRSKLVALEGHRANARKTATDQLINEALELQEAKRLKIDVSDSQVNAGILSVARNIKVSTDKLKTILAANGVGTATLRARVRAGIAWSKITQGLIAPRVQMSELALEKKAAGKLTSQNTYDYILTQIMFVIPGGKGSVGARTADANRYRREFKGCASAVQLSTHFRDAGVVKIGRRNATQLPPAVAKELSKTPVGGLTRPHAVPGGVQMLAVCKKHKARDLTFLTDKLRQTEGTDKLKAEAAKYLANLKAKAKITYR